MRPFSDNAKYIVTTYYACNIRQVTYFHNLHVSVD